MPAKKRPGRPRKTPKPEPLPPDDEPETEPSAKDHIPSVESQGFVFHKIDNSKLLGNSGTPRFNGSIVRHKGKLLLGYRYYNPQADGKTQVAIAELDDSYQPVANYHINLPPHGSTRIFEDCRLFEHNGKLYMSFVELDIFGYPNFRAIQRLVQLGKNYQQAVDFRLKVGRNYKSVEKNWSYYSDNGRLRCVYDIPQQHFFAVDEANCAACQESKGKPIMWNMGHLRGGTPLIPHEGGFIGFHHTGTDHEWLIRRYGMGTYIVRDGQVTDISPSFIYGTKEEEWCGAGNPRCVFPAGVIDDGDKFLVSCGVNDTFNAVIEIPKETAVKDLRPVSHYHTDHSRCWRIKKPRPILTLFGKEPVGMISAVSGIYGRTHIFKTEDPWAIRSLEAADNAEEISLDEYTTEEARLATRSPSIVIPDYIRKKR